MWKKQSRRICGVVHHGVYAAEFLDASLDHRARGVRFGDAAGVGNRVAARCLDFLNHLLRRSFRLAGAFQRRAQIVNHHGGAFGRSHQRNISTDPATRSGDQNNLSIKCL